MKLVGVLLALFGWLLPVVALNMTSSTGARMFLSILGIGYHAVRDSQSGEQGPPEGSGLEAVTAAIGSARLDSYDIEDAAKISPRSTSLGDMQ